MKNFNGKILFLYTRIFIFLRRRLIVLEINRASAEKYTRRAK